MAKLFFVGLGGFIGTIFRYWLSGLIARRYGETFPLGTLVLPELDGMIKDGLVTLEQVKVGHYKSSV